MLRAFATRGCERICKMPDFRFMSGEFKAARKLLCEYSRGSAKDDLQNHGGAY